MNGSRGSTADTKSSFLKKRSAPRDSLIATVEIIEPATNTHFYGRISKIGRDGCYVDVLNTLRQGTLVQMMLSGDKGESLMSTTRWRWELFLPRYQRTRCKFSIHGLLS